MADFGGPSGRPSGRGLSRADVRPFAALRYQADAVGDLSVVLAPPYDTISPEERRTLLQRSPHNVVRLELPEPAASGAADPYEQAGVTLRSWLAEGVLARDAEPALYLYEQEFRHQERRLTRRTLFARLRLEPWDSGIVRPHERTLPAPKEDRLRLLRVTRANISPVFVLYRDAGGELARLIDGPAARPLTEAETPDGQRHRLAVLGAGASAALSAAFRQRTLYIADGHHRYETALAYREEGRRDVTSWTGEEPENFVLAGLTAAEDPGLLVLPIHRLLSITPPSDVLQRLRESFDVSDAGPAAVGAPLESMLARLREAGGRGVAQTGGRPAAFAAVGLETGRFTILALRGADEARGVPPSRPPIAGRVDTAILRHVVLEKALGLSSADLETDAVTYSEDAEFAVREVLAGRVRLAFLLNPIPAELVLALADAGERLPQKSTYFHPKLPTGLVLNALE